MLLKNFELGNVGVGTGCSVGKLLGSKYSMNGGIGFSSHVFGDGTVVECLVAVNALGSIVNPENGEIIAGPKRDGKIYDSVDLYLNGKIQSDTKISLELCSFPLLSILVVFI